MPEAANRFAVLIFTDIVNSAGLKIRHGVPAYREAIRIHNGYFDRLARESPNIHVLQNTGDGYFAEARGIAQAVDFALRFQHEMREGPWGEVRLAARVGIHAGELSELDSEGGNVIVAPAADLAARVMSLALGGQILMTRFLFDEARHFIRKHPSVPDRDTPSLKWLAHGPYLMQGRDDLIEVFEVGAEGLAPLAAPPDGEKAKRAIRPGEEETLGWRPAVGLEIPGRPGWYLIEPLGAGGFGEVWSGEHEKLRQRRAFKFCFDDERLRALKREVTLVRLLKSALGDRDDIVHIHELRLDAPPFYLESDLAPHGNLLQWAEKQGGLGTIPLDRRIALVAHTASALAAAHSIGVLHKDIKPTNILIFDGPDGEPMPRLVDFGIGTLADPSVLVQHGVTSAGFTRPTIQHSTGTPTYSPPEYLAGRPYTIQGDIYGVGVLLYQLVTDKPHDPLAPGWERDIADPLLREDIAACVDGDPARRLPSATELAERLQSLDQRREEAAAKCRLEIQAAAAIRQRRRVKWLLATSALGLLLTLGAVTLAIRETRRSRELDVARGTAEKARGVALQSVTSLRTGTGTMRGDAGNVSLGALWMAEAVGSAGESPTEARNARIRFQNYAQSAPFPVGCIRPQNGVAVRRMTFHPHRSRLLIQTGNGAWELHDVEGDGLVKLPGQGPISGAAWTEDGAWLCTVDSTGAVRLIDDETGDVLAEVTVETNVTVLSVSADGRWLAVAGDNLMLFSIREREGKLQLLPCGDPVPLNSNGPPPGWGGFSPDTTSLVVSSYGEPGLVRIFKVKPDLSPSLIGETQHCLRSHEACQPPVFLPDNSLAILKDFKHTALVSWSGGKVMLQNTPRLAVIGDSYEMVKSISATLDGSILAVGGFRYFGLYDVTAEKETEPFMNVPYNLNFLGFTPGGTHLVAAGDQGTVRIWRRIGSTQTLLRQWYAASGFSHCAALSPNGALLAVADNSGPMIRLWGGLYGGPMAVTAPFDGQWSRTTVSPSGRFFIASGNTFRSSRLSSAAVYETESLKATGAALRFSDPVQAAVFSSDENHVFTAGGNDTQASLKKWDFHTGSEVVPELRLPQKPFALAVSPDGRYLAVLMRNGSILVATSSDLRKVTVVTFTHGTINNNFYFINCLLQWQADGILSVAMLGNAGHFRMDNEVLTPVEKSISTGSHINLFVPGPGGKHWVTGGMDSRVRSWNMQAGKLAPLPELSHPSWVFGGEFTADGNELLTPCSDGFTRVWDWRTGQQLYPPTGMPGSVFFARWLPGDQEYVTGCTDTSVRLWEKNSGLPLTPPVFTGVWPLLSMEMVPGRRTLLVTARSPWVTAIRLDDWLKAPDDPQPALREFAEVMANTRLNGSAEERLTCDEWEARWQRLRQTSFYARERQSLAQRTMAWHQMEVQLARHQNCTPAVAVHATALERNDRPPHSPAPPDARPVSGAAR